MMNTSSLGIYAFLCFIHGICNAGSYSVTYVLLLELMPVSHQMTLGLLVDFIQGFVQIYIGFSLQFLSKDYKSLTRI